MTMVSTLCLDCALQPAAVVISAGPGGPGSAGDDRMVAGRCGPLPDTVLLDRAHGPTEQDRIT